MHFIILKLNVHKIKLNQDSKMVNFNYKIYNSNIRNSQRMWTEHQ